MRAVRTCARSSSAAPQDPPSPPRRWGFLLGQHPTRSDQRGNGCAQRLAVPSRSVASVDRGLRRRPSLSRDITARLQAEARVRDAEKRLRLAISIGDGATWDLYLATGENRWSESHFILLGYQPTPGRLATEEMWKCAVLPEDLPRVQAEMVRAFTAGDVLRSEHLRRPLGEIRGHAVAGGVAFVPRSCWSEWCQAPPCASHCRSRGGIILE